MKGFMMTFDFRYQLFVHESIDWPFEEGLEELALLEELISSPLEQELWDALCEAWFENNWEAAEDYEFIIVAN